MQDLRKFVLNKWIVIFGAEQVYLKRQVTNLKNKEVAAIPKPKSCQTQKKIDLSKILKTKSQTLEK